MCKCHTHAQCVLLHHESIKTTRKEQALLLAALPVLRVLGHLAEIYWIPPHIHIVFSPEGSQGVVGGCVLGGVNHIKGFKPHPLQDQTELLTLALKFIRL